MPRSLYIHVPFCEVKCSYCDFFSVPRGHEDFDLQKGYVDALIREINQRYASFPRRPVQSIFFGGGTPSLLDPPLLESILNALGQRFSWDKQAEITLEANPKTVSREKLAAFRALGINRLSIGVQSFQDRFLRVLGRIHNGDEARRTLDDARAAGFENVSLDLIFTIPGQSIEDWKKDLEEAISFGIPHLSCYHLEGGRLNPTNEEEGIRCLTWTRERLCQARIEPYEISNFSRPGFESVHNSNYWRYGEYLGFGTAAASFMKIPPSPLFQRGDFGVRRRQTNVRDLKRYLEGDLVDFSEEIGLATAMGEFCMLALRTREGIGEEAFRDEFSISFSETFPSQITRWVKRGWLERRGGGWRLTEAGILFTDEVAASFIA